MLTIVLLFLVLLILKLVPIVITNNNVMFIKPMWGIGNRLRTIRKLIPVAKYTNRRIILIEHEDDGLQKITMKKLFGIPFLHIPMYLFILIYSRTCVTIKYNVECTLKYDIQEIVDKSVGRNVLMIGCEVNINKINMEDRSLYDIWNPYKDNNTNTLINQIKSHNGKVIGVHIRQGNINDWERGYFFSEEWRGIKDKEPESAPHFCCYEDKSKNLSACTSNVQGLEGFIREMKKYPKDVKFFICSDRTGCMLHLYQLFPQRIISNSVDIETPKLDIYKGMQDFLALSECDEIIVTNVSSFSKEASMIRNIPVRRIQKKDT
tara:strand:+ start:2471 stop:3430 length:960 start_codon:yes stop_codon:yes gene_type:complete